MQGTRLVNTLTELAQSYGVSKRTLYMWIDEYPELKEKIKPFRDGYKKIYPPAILDEIKAKFGEP